MNDDKQQGIVNSAAELFGEAPKRRFKVVGPLPVNGKQIRIRSLFEGELSAYQTKAITAEGFSPIKMEAQNRRLIAACMVDADGNLLLQDVQAGRLREWDGADTSYLYEECAKHVGIKREGIEAIAKNSEETPAADLD